jgi:hypothetical protein
VHMQAAEAPRASDATRPPRILSRVANLWLEEIRHVAPAVFAPGPHRSVRGRLARITSP